MTMKLRPASSNHTGGSVLLACILTAAVVTIVLTCYLNLVSAQNLSIVRSQSWNAAMPVLEAGVEEALTHLYYSGGGSNLGVNGWTEDSGVYHKFRSVGANWVHVSISNTAASSPMIYARGYVTAPEQTNRMIERVVQVRARRDGLFSKGMVARGQITLNGNNAIVDSFDSTDPNYSTNGLYLFTRRKGNGVVASNAGISNAVNTGNADIIGRVATGPGGTVGIGPNGKVGDLGWLTNSLAAGIQPGRSTDDMNVSFPDVVAPFTSAATPSVGSGTYSGYDYVISSSGNWMVGDLRKGVLVRSNVQAVLLVTGTINFTGNDDAIKIETGGSLHLYMKGTSASISGNGVVNEGARATNFFYWGLPENTSLTVKGNGAFSGVIYAPSADFTMNGGGADHEDIVGASVTKTARVNGNFQFHYDESLGNLGYYRGYVVTAWNEL
jgi:hypothetical protein